MRISSLFLIGLTVLLGAACSKVNMENYSRLKVGQSYDEIVAIVGQPERCDEVLGVRHCLWGSDSQGFKIGFVGNASLTMSAHNLK